MSGSNSRPTAKTVAEWMAAQFEKDSWLDQETAATGILGEFGEKFTYENAGGNLAIGKDVLREFRELTKDTAIWVRSDRAWRRRDKSDGPGRQE